MQSEPRAPQQSSSGLGLSSCLGRNVMFFFSLFLPFCHQLFTCLCSRNMSVFTKQFPKN